MTSLSGLQYQGLSLPSAGGYLTTPTTMSSPFFSSGPLSGLSTPMSARPTSYSTAYNPQEWGPIAPGSSPIGIGVMTPVSAGMHRGLAARTGWFRLVRRVITLCSHVYFRCFCGRSAAAALLPPSFAESRKHSVSELGDVSNQRSAFSGDDPSA